MKTRTFAILSLALSLVLHLLLFRVPMRMMGAGPLLNPQEDITQNETVVPITLSNQNILDDLNKIDEIMQSDPSSKSASDFQTPEMPLEKSVEPMPDLLPPDDMRRKMADTLNEVLHEESVNLYEMADVNAELPSLSDQLTSTPDIPIPTAPAPEIIAVKVDAVPTTVDATRPVFADVPRELVPTDIKLPSLAKPGELDLTGGQLPGIRQLSSSLTAPVIGGPGIGEGDFDIPELPELPDAEALDLPPPITTPPEIKVNPDPQHPVTRPLDEFVNVRVTVYPDPIGPGGHFQVDISPRRNSDAMDEIPKDVLFIVDRSGSISLPKFEQFRQAIKELLPALNPQDRFNIISFNDKPYKFFENFIPATSKNVQSASEQVGRLPYGGKTDVFGGLAPFVKQSNGDPTRPLNIFLLTDGNSTVNIFKDSDFLHELVGLNPGNVSIFPFSAGDNAKTNHSLLSFLGYLNHGRLQHVDTLGQIRGGMAEFFQSYSSIIVADIQCRVLQGAVPQEIYPKRLPHLYRNQVLTILGRYTDRADTLSLRITGRDATQTTRSLIFERKLSQCAVGDAQLPERWGGQKLLYLLAQRNSTSNPAEIARLEQVIAELRKQYRTFSLY